MLEGKGLRLIDGLDEVISTCVSRNAGIRGFEKSPKQLN